MMSVPSMPVPPRLFGTCMKCPKRAACRLWRNPGDQWCEHWPVDELPSLPRLAGRVIVAGARHILTGARECTPEELQARRDICAACKAHWDPDAFGGLGRCRHPKCGCSGVKLQWSSQACPMGKWQAIV